MKIELRCKCGAFAVFSDGRGTFIRSGGQQDDRGRVYLVELRADEWLDWHKRACYDPSMIQSERERK